MAEPTIGEIRMFGGNYAPAGWALCNGAVVAITENETLFNLIGTTFGGDGQETFNLPNLQSCVPVHNGNDGTSQTYVIGQTGGVETVNLSTAQIPAHTHSWLASLNPASSNAPANNVPAVAPNATVTPYGTDFPLVTLNTAAMGQTGGSTPHSNLQPYVTVTFIIALVGVFPTFP